MGQKIIKKVIKHFRKKKTTSKAIPTADKTKPRNNQNERRNEV